MQGDYYSQGPPQPAYIPAYTGYVPYGYPPMAPMMPVHRNLEKIKKSKQKNMNMRKYEETNNSTDESIHLVKSRKSGESAPTRTEIDVMSKKRSQSGNSLGHVQCTEDHCDSSHHSNRQLSRSEERCVSANSGGEIECSSDNQISSEAQLSSPSSKSKSKKRKDKKTRSKCSYHYSDVENMPYTETRFVEHGYCGNSQPQYSCCVPLPQGYPYTQQAQPELITFDPNTPPQYQTQYQVTNEHYNFQTPYPGYESAPGAPVSVPVTVMPVPVDYSAYQQQPTAYQQSAPTQVQFEVTTQPFYPTPPPVTETSYAIQAIPAPTQVEPIVYPSQSYAPVVDPQSKYVPGLPPGAKIVAEYFLGYLDDPVVQQQAQEFCQPPPPYQVEATAFQTEAPCVEQPCQQACQPVSYEQNICQPTDYQQVSYQYNPDPCPQPCPQPCEPAPVQQISYQTPCQPVCQMPCQQQAPQPTQVSYSYPTPQYQYNQYPNQCPKEEIDIEVWESKRNDSRYPSGNNLVPQQEYYNPPPQRSCNEDCQPKKCNDDRDLKQLKDDIIRTIQAELGNLKLDVGNKSSEPIQPIFLMPKQSEQSQKPVYIPRNIYVPVIRPVFVPRERIIVRPQIIHVARPVLVDRPVPIQQRPIVIERDRPVPIRVETIERTEPLGANCTGDLARNIESGQEVTYHEFTQTYPADPSKNYTYTEQTDYDEEDRRKQEVMSILEEAERRKQVLLSKSNENLVTSGQYNYQTSDTTSKVLDSMLGNNQGYTLEVLDQRVSDKFEKTDTETIKARYGVDSFNYLPTDANRNNNSGSEYYGNNTTQNLGKSGSYKSLGSGNDVRASNSSSNIFTNYGVGDAPTPFANTPFGTVTNVTQIPSPGSRGLGSSAQTPVAKLIQNYTGYTSDNTPNTSINE